MNTQDSSWTRALMASSGIAVGHDQTPRHESAEWHEASAAGTSLARLQKLATFRDESIRTLVARRVDCPIGLLATLAFDRSSDVRAGVAGNPRITEPVAEHLARDRDPKVVKALARNHAIDLALLQRLAVHRKEDVRRVASRNLDERVYGHDSNAVAPVQSEVKQSALPAELRDRVAAPPEWLPAAEETSRPRLGPSSTDVSRQASFLPRFHAH